MFGFQVAKIESDIWGVQIKNKFCRQHFSTKQGMEVKRSVHWKGIWLQIVPDVLKNVHMTNWGQAGGLFCGLLVNWSRFY